MFKNYLKTAVRSLTRHLGYSFINIFGLSLGILCTLFIAMFVYNEISFDKFHENYRRIYRIDSHFILNGKDDLFALTAIPVGPTLKDDFPEVVECVRFLQGGERFFIRDDKKFLEDNVYVADSTVFSVFSYEFIAGDPRTCLVKPNTIVLTKSLADKFFGDEYPIGQSLEIAQRGVYNVTAVIEDVPQNSHLQFTALISSTTLQERVGAQRFNDRSSGSFWNIQAYTYIMLSENASIQSVLEKSPEFYEKYMAELGNQINGKFSLMATNLADTHFTEGLQWELPTGNISYVYIFSIVAFFILLIASINYMNMATAKSANRAKEVGIRKVMGAQRSNLVSQFLIESVILAVISLVIAVLVAVFLLPWFNNLSGKDLDISLLWNPLFALVIIGITVLVGVVSGSYPAFFLSSFTPARVVKEKLTTTGSSGILRKILVIVQFTISTGMIIGTIIVAKQLSYFQTKDLGYDKENVLVTAVQDTSVIRNMEAFRKELEQNTNILATTTMNTNIGQSTGKVVYRVEGENGQLTEMGINFIFSDYDFASLLNLELMEGRFYSREMGTDLTEAFVVNETLVRQYGWEDNPIGKRIQFGIDVDGSAARDGRVVGVMKDFNYQSLHNPVEPVIWMLIDRPMPQLYIRIAERKVPETVEFIQKKWNEFNRLYPFDYSFLEDNLSEAYVAEEKLGTLFRIFSILTIFISCLGLYGLSSFMTEQRTKEIGIRKILGASESNIVYHLSIQLIWLVIISVVISIPGAWYLMDRWLNDYVYKIKMGVFPFLLATISALLIAILTVSYHSVKAARMNPVDSLKYE